VVALKRSAAIPSINSKAKAPGDNTRQTSWFENAQPPSWVKQRRSDQTDYGSILVAGIEEGLKSKIKKK